MCKILYILLLIDIYAQHIYLCEGSERTQCKIEEIVQYWVAKEKKAAMNYCRALELNNTVSNKRVQQLYSEDQPQEVIDQAERQAGSARRTLESI